MFGVKNKLIDTELLVLAHTHTQSVRVIKKGFGVYKELINTKKLDFYGAFGKKHSEFTDN